MKRSAAYNINFQHQWMQKENAELAGNGNKKGGLVESAWSAWPQEVILYEQGICRLFESIEHSMQGKSIKIIRQKLNVAKCLWSHSMNGELGRLLSGPVSQSQLNELVHIFCHCVRTGSFQQNPSLSINIPSSSLLCPLPEQFQNMVDPYNALEKYSKDLTPQFLEGAAELITLSLTKIQFSRFESTPLTLGCIRAIKEHKNLKFEIQQNNPSQHLQIQETKSLYLGLLSEIENMEIPQFQQ